METSRLTRDDWLRAARRALLAGGPGAVRVEPLARELGVTKGSFYWHFADRGALLEALLVEWEEELDLALRELPPLHGPSGVRAVMKFIAPRVVASERGEVPSDAAIFAWAASDRAVARRVQAAEERRIAFFQKLAGDHDLGEFLYLAYLGFLTRRRRVPAAAAFFPRLARLTARITALLGKAGRRSWSRRTGATVLMLLTPVITACVELRVIRWGAPPPEQQEQIFHNRVVRRAGEPFVFHRAPQRTDLDTITVHSAQGRWISWAEYMDEGSIRAFLVVRNDSILYERYHAGTSDSTRFGSYSMAKAFTSALLGIAWGDGTIQSLDDQVSKYLPELAARAPYAGVTLRHALDMRTGIEYRRATGSPWSDLRSHDALYYYTTDLERTLLRMGRAEPPGSDWAYRDSDTQLLAWVLTRATGTTLAGLLESRVWQRIGAEFDASWSLDREGGMEKAATGVNATVRDYARFGRLFLHGGRAGGEQVVPAEWVERSTTLDTTRTRAEVRTWWGMQHRTLWWIPMLDWDAHRDFYADGAKGQRLYVHAPSRTIIVQIADSDMQDFPFRRIVYYLLGEPYAYPW